MNWLLKGVMILIIHLADYVLIPNHMLQPVTCLVITRNKLPEQKRFPAAATVLIMGT